MKKKNLRIISLILCAIVLLGAACACSARSMANDMMSYNGATGGSSAPTAAAAAPTGESDMYREEMYDTAAQDAGSAVAGGGMGATPVVPANANQKIIYSVYLSIETTDYEPSLKTVQDLTQEFGGYIQSSSISGQGINSYNSSRYTNYTLRIPATNINGFLAKIPAAGSITNQQNTGEDVSDRYFDIEAHLKTLKTTEERLLSLLEKTGELKDIIELENALSNTRYEIESLEGQMRRLDSYISYSTITIDLYEVMKYTPINELPKTLGERISQRFDRSVESVVDGFENFMVWLIGGSPVLLITLLILALIALAAIIVVKIIVRASKRARERNEAKYQAMRAEYQPKSVFDSPPVQPGQDEDKS